MLRIAIVEDNTRECEEIRRYVIAYFKQQRKPVELSVFENGDQFLQTVLSQKQGIVDILLMDVEMEGHNGIETAREIRKTDEDVIIVFITHLEQYAIEGYRVQAYDYLIKPVSYEMFCDCMDAVMSKYRKKQQNVIMVQVRKQVVFLNKDDIIYVETNLKKVIIHTKKEQIYATETMTGMEQKLGGESFYRIHTAFLVNMKHISGVDDLTVFLGDTRLAISKHRKREFLQTFARYMGLAYE